MLISLFVISIILEKILNFNNQNIKFIRANVGDRHVKEKMKKLRFNESAEMGSDTWKKRMVANGALMKKNNVKIHKSLGQFKGQILNRKMELIIFAKEVFSASINGHNLKIKKLKDNKYSVQVSEVNLSQENNLILNLSAY